MAVYSGKDGRVEFNNTATTRVKSWSFQASVDTLETTDLGDDARAYVAGLKSATGSMSIIYHDDNSSLRTLLDNVITQGSSPLAKFELMWGKKQVTFSGYVTSAAITCGVGEIMSADVNFTMSGDYTSATL